MDTKKDLIINEHIENINHISNENVRTTDARDVRQAFMDIVYSELESDPDNNKANRIIEVADEYAESAQLGTNLAEVDTDTISRQDAIDALDEYFDRIGKLKRRGLTKGERAISLDVVGTIRTLPSAQPDGEYISRQAVTESDLIDWYINSVDESEPVWTEEHIHELFNDFYLIPKED